MWEEDVQCLVLIKPVVPLFVRSSFQESILCPEERVTQLPGFPEHKRAFCQLHYIGFPDLMALQG